MAVATRSETDPAGAGRAALARGAWAEARGPLEQAVAADPDSAAAWEDLSWAAWWQGDAAATLAAREAAHRAFRRSGDACGAARCAAWLASDLRDFRGDEVVAAAWLRRAEALVEGRAACPEQALVRLFAAEAALLDDADPVAAGAHARAAVALARQVGDPDGEAVGLAMLGSALVAAGEVADGLDRLEAAAALAISEELTRPVSAGWTLCRTATACADVGDLHRADRWLRVLHRFSATWGGRHFFGACRAAWGGVLTARGAWAQAEEELVSARADLRAVRPGLAAAGAVRLAELRARQGDDAAARALLEEALPAPEAITALGALDLAAGDPVAAREAAERVLRRVAPANRLDRLGALGLLAGAHAAAGDHGAAGAAADALEAAAAAVATALPRARARHVRAVVAAAAGAHDEARRAAEDAVDAFTACTAPFEAAHARLVLAGALAALGRPDRAAAQERAARDALAGLGAQAPPAAGTPPAGELSLREAEVLRLVAQGRSDAQIAERLFLSPHTVHRHVANVRAKLRAPSRAAAVAHATRLGLL